MRINIIHLIPPIVIIAPVVAAARELIAFQDIIAKYYPGAVGHVATNITLTNEEREAIHDKSAVRVVTPNLRLYKILSSSKAIIGWLFVDDVIGKHENITYALALTPIGTTLGVEVMTYRENYGGEVATENWRKQFANIDVTKNLEVGSDITNISGATLSCVHLTKGIKRLLHTFKIISSRIH